MGVVGGRGREAVEIGGEEVGLGAAGAPGGEAGGYPLLGLCVVDRLLERARVPAVDEDAGVGGLELVVDLCAAAWHARVGRGEQPAFMMGLERADGWHAEEEPVDEGEDAQEAEGYLGVHEDDAVNGVEGEDDQGDHFLV